MTTRIPNVLLVAVFVVSAGLAQTPGVERPTLLQDRGLQLGLQIGGLIGDNEQPKEMRIIRWDNIFVDFFGTFSGRAFLDFGLINHVRGQFGASFGSIKGRYYTTTLVPIDYRFLVIPYYSKNLNPYFYLGVGALHYDASVVKTHLSPDAKTNGWAAFVPGGIGIVQQISHCLALDFNVGYNFIFNDDVNGHRASTNDSYWSGSFGLRMPLGKTAAERQEEELQKQIADQERQRKEAEIRAAEEQRQKALEAQKAAEQQKKEAEMRVAEEQKRKEEEARKAAVQQKPKEEPVQKVEAPQVPKVEIKFEPIYFRIGGSKLAATELEKLNVAAKTLQENPDVKVQVSGYADSTGKYISNMKLSSARAEAVKQYLVGKGVQGERLTTEGYSSDKPAATNTTVEGRQLNRRAELQVVK